jgi:putative transcriptional regulator
MSEADDSLAGRLLVASPVLADPNFARTVVLMIEHSADGALGVVLNRPSDVPACEAVPMLADVLDEGDTLYAGGPVQPDAAIALAEYREPAAPGEVRIVGPVGVLGADEVEAEDLEEVVTRVRVFLGYAGWGSGQLEGELESEAWIVEPAQPDDVFAGEANALWSAVLERKGGPFRLLARMPEDPSLN